MREPFGLCLVALECDCHHIEHAFQTSVRRSLAAFEIFAGCPYDAGLLCPVDVFLWWRLYVQATGLYLYKMYSICSERDQVYLQMSAAPVPFKDGVSHALQQCACNVLSQLS